MINVGVDVGGTFTDFVVFDDQTRELTIRKVPSTPANPAEAILTGLREYFSESARPDEIGSFLHGTTITTNALIQRRGARCGLLVTKDLKGIFQVQSQMKVGPYYSMKRGRPPALIDERDVFEVPERIDRSGKVIHELDEDAVAAIGDEIARRGLSSLAICFLFSFAHPEHERRAKQIIAQRAPSCQVFCSADILPRIREWPRMSTTILDAYLEPVLVSYVASLVEGLCALGVDTPKTFLMESNGGVMPFSALEVGGKACHTLLSGPAAAVQAAKRLAEVNEMRDLVTMDLGGTSCDIAFVKSGNALEVTGGEICGYDLYVPMLDIATIGAGGGTIARVDPDGRLKVGPESAGADPGPAAYGRGGSDATITDADVVLGYLDPQYFLGGGLVLDEARARSAIERNLAAPLGTSVEEAALAMVRVNDAHMTDAIRVVAAKAAVTLSDCRLVACGGAGPVHAAGVAEELGITEILVPESPGVFAALGLLCTDVAQDYVQTDIVRLDADAPRAIRENFATLESRAVTDFSQQGFSRDELRFVREVDARYAGQGFEIRVVVSDLGSSDVAGQLVSSFHRRHHEVYSHASESEAVEIVNYRLRVVVEMPQYRPIEHANEEAPFVPPVTRTVQFRSGPATAAIVRREHLKVGSELDGPAVVQQPDTTTVVPPGWRASVDRYGTLILSRAAG